MKTSTSTTIKSPPLLLLGEGAVHDFEHGRPEKFVPSGIKALDNYILGAIHGEMTLIAGNPGQGKTSLAMQWAVQTAQNGDATGVISLEMGRAALRNRLISGMTGIPMQMLRTREWAGPKQKALAIQAAEYLAQIPLYVDDRSGLLPQQVYDTVVGWKNQGIGLVVLDYIQRMGGVGDNRVQQVGEAARAIKNAAKDADLPVIALSSLNRSGNTGEKPKMSHLRDSGEIEFEADTIIMLHYPEDDLYEDIRQAEFHIMKQRNGPTGVAEALFNKPATRFEDR